MGVVCGRFVTSLKLKKIGFELGLLWVWIGFAFFVGLGVKNVVRASTARGCSVSWNWEIGFAFSNKGTRKMHLFLKYPRIL